MSAIKKIDTFIDSTSSNLLVVAVSLMLIFSFFSIVLRWFGIGFMWVDPMVRHLIFVSTFLGGVLATGRGTHIGIDILGKIFEARNNVKGLIIVRRIIGVTALVTLVWLAKASYDFMIIELKYGKPSFFGIHSGVLVGITPVGFLLIAARYICQLILSFSEKEGEG